MAVQPLARRNTCAALATPASNSASMPGFTSICAISRTMGISLPAAPADFTDGLRYAIAGAGGRTRAADAGCAPAPLVDTNVVTARARRPGTLRQIPQAPGARDRT